MPTAILLEQYGAVYIDIAKVASSSLKVVFALALELDIRRANGNPHSIDYPSPATFDPGGDRLFPGLYAFGFVRNPWDRLVSCYRDKIAGEVADFTGMSATGVAHCLARFDAFRRGMSFAEFVSAVAQIPDSEADEHFRPQHCSLTNDRGALAVDFVGRYENLGADFSHVARRIGLPPHLTLPKLQANPRPVDYRSYYSPATRDLVASRFARDIELLAYEFG
jgi:chondroitin 4-sulfotransferase 11